MGFLFFLSCSQTLAVCRDIAYNNIRFNLQVVRNHLAMLLLWDNWNKKPTQENLIGRKSSRFTPEILPVSSRFPHELESVLRYDFMATAPVLGAAHIVNTLKPIQHKSKEWIP